VFSKRAARSIVRRASIYSRGSRRAPSRGQWSVRGLCRSPRRCSLDSGHNRFAGDRPSSCNPSSLRLNGGMLLQFGEHPLRARLHDRRRADLLERSSRRACEERPGKQHRDRQCKRSSQRDVTYSAHLQAGHIWCRSRSRPRWPCREIRLRTRS